MRALGLLLLAAAAALALWLGVATPLGAAIYSVVPPFLNTLQAGVQRNLSPALWDEVLLPVLEAPAWALPLALGLLLLAASLLVGRARRR